MLKYAEVEMPKEFTFPIACTDIAVSYDGKKLIAGGVYKPTVKFFDLKTGIAKYERHLVADLLKIVCLDDEAEKYAVLRNDKNIEFHLKSGLYEKILLPFQPKDVCLNRVASEMYFVGNNNQMLRFSLEQGRFLKSIENGKGTRVCFSSQHGLIGVSNNNIATFIDSRMKEAIYQMNVESEILSIAQDNTGLKYAIGTETGMLAEYDFRSMSPVSTYEHNGHVTDICYSQKYLFSSTTNEIRVSDSKEHEIINPGFLINTFSVDGGMLYVGGESENIKGFSFESIGRIPPFAFECQKK